MCSGSDLTQRYSPRTHPLDEKGVAFYDPAMKAPASALACPKCNAPLPRRNRGDACTSRKAKALYGVAGIVGGLWALVVALWSPVFLVPRGLGGFAICAAFYLFPGFLIGMYASILPKVRTLSCTRCGWSEVQMLST